jgi:hypothetical protein
MPDDYVRSIEPLIAIILARLCGSDPLGSPHPLSAALLGRFLPRLGPLVATQAAFLSTADGLGHSQASALRNPDADGRFRAVA